MYGQGKKSPSPGRGQYQNTGSQGKSEPIYSTSISPYATSQPRFGASSRVSQTNGSPQRRQDPADPLSWRNTSPTVRKGAARQSQKTGPLPAIDTRGSSFEPVGNERRAAQGTKRSTQGGLDTTTDPFMQTSAMTAKTLFAESKKNWIDLGLPASEIEYLATMLTSPRENHGSILSLSARLQHLLSGSREIVDAYSTRMKALRYLWTSREACLISSVRGTPPPSSVTKSSVSRALLDLRGSTIAICKTLSEVNDNWGPVFNPQIICDRLVWSDTDPAIASPSSRLSPHNLLLRIVSGDIPDMAESGGFHSVLANFENPATGKQQMYFEPHSTVLKREEFELIEDMVYQYEEGMARRDDNGRDERIKLQNDALMSPVSFRILCNILGFALPDEFPENAKDERCLALQMMLGVESPIMEEREETPVPLLFLQHLLSTAGSVDACGLWAQSAYSILTGEERRLTDMKAEEKKIWKRGIGIHKDKVPDGAMVLREKGDTHYVRMQMHRATAWGGMGFQYPENTMNGRFFPVIGKRKGDESKRQTGQTGYSADSTDESPPEPAAPSIQHKGKSSISSSSSSSSSSSQIVMNKRKSEAEDSFDAKDQHQGRIPPSDFSSPSNSHDSSSSSTSSSTSSSSSGSKSSDSSIPPLKVTRSQPLTTLETIGLSEDQLRSLAEDLHKCLTADDKGIDLNGVIEIYSHHTRRQNEEIVKVHNQIYGQEVSALVDTEIDEPIRLLAQLLSWRPGAMEAYAIRDRVVCGVPHRNIGVLTDILGTRTQDELLDIAAQYETMAAHGGEGWQRSAISGNFRADVMAAIESIGSPPDLIWFFDAALTTKRNPDMAIDDELLRSDVERLIELATGKRTVQGNPEELSFVLEIVFVRCTSHLCAISQALEDEGRPITRVIAPCFQGQLRRGAAAKVCAQFSRALKWAIVFQGSVPMAPGGREDLDAIMLAVASIYDTDYMPEIRASFEEQTGDTLDAFVPTLTQGEMSVWLAKLLKNQAGTAESQDSSDAQ